MLLRLNEKICANYVTNCLEDNKSLINISLYCCCYCQYKLYRTGSMQSNAVVEIVMDYKSPSLYSKPFLLNKNLNESKDESHSVQLFATPWTVACEVPLSMEFSRPEYGVDSHFLLQGIFPTLGLNPGLPHCSTFLSSR